MSSPRRLVEVGRAPSRPPHAGAASARERSSPPAPPHARPRGPGPGASPAGNGRPPATGRRPAGGRRVQPARRRSAGPGRPGRSRRGPFSAGGDRGSRLRPAHGVRRGRRAGVRRPARRGPGSSRADGHLPLDGHGVHVGSLRVERRLAHIPVAGPAADRGADHEPRLRPRDPGRAVEPVGSDRERMAGRAARRAPTSALGAWRRRSAADAPAYRRRPSSMTPTSTAPRSPWVPRPRT